MADDPAPAEPEDDADEEAEEEEPPPPPRRVTRRARTPTLLQMEAVECGAAALGIVLAHYGRWESLEHLRVECGVSRDGSKAANVLRAARKFGLEAQGWRKEPNELAELNLPLIVFWNFNHFLVVEGFGKGKVWLNDPARGPVVVTDEEFDHGFTGVALEFRKTPEFKPGGAPPSTAKALARRFVGIRSAFALVVLAGLGLVVPGLMIPAFSKVFVDDILVRGMESWTMPLILAMGCTALLRACLTALQQYHLSRSQTKLALSTTSRFMWRFLRLPVEFFLQRQAGDMSNRVQSNEQVAKLLSGDLATTGIGIVMLVFYAALMFRYDVALTVVGIGLTGLNVLAMRRVARSRRDANQRLLHDKGKLMSTAMGGLQIIETIKATGAEMDFFSRWAGYQAKVANAKQELAVSTYWLDAVPPFLGLITTAAILGLGGLKVMDGELSMGMLVAYQSLMAGFGAPVTNLVNLGASLQEMDGNMRRLDDVMDYPEDETFLEETVAAGPAAEITAGATELGARASRPPERAGRPRTSRRGKLEGRLELRGIVFGYSRVEKPLVTGFDLKLEPGGRVAITGGSGSGKSTIAKMIAGINRPWEGEILFDGLPRTAHLRATMSESLAVVDQDIMLFEGSVRENLTLWDSTVPDARVVAAARDACIHDDIAARAGGYDGRVEEGGRNFSGGQRQRLEIARALAVEPSLLILDEATSALDALTEKIFMDNLRRRGVACVIVAHRLSTIRDADEILVMERGKVVERGTHDELMKNDGPYRRLVRQA